MNVLLGVIIILALIFVLGKFTGMLGEKLMVVLMALFIFILFMVTLGYSFL